MPLSTFAQTPVTDSRQNITFSAPIYHLSFIITNITVVIWQWWRRLRMVWTCYCFNLHQVCAIKEPTVIGDGTVLSPLRCWLHKDSPGGNLMGTIKNCAKFPADAIPKSEIVQRDNWLRVDRDGHAWLTSAIESIGSLSCWLVGILGQGNLHRDAPLWVKALQVTSTNSLEVWYYTSTG
jgi:hypothetical protein